MSSRDYLTILERAKQMRQLTASLYATALEIADRTKRLREQLADTLLTVQSIRALDNLQTDLRAHFSIARTRLESDSEKG